MTTPVRTITRSVFTRDSSEAERDAIVGPVYITDQGQPSHVLLSWAQYEQLAFGDSRPLVDPLARPAGIADIELEIPDRRESTIRPVELN